MKVKFWGARGSIPVSGAEYLKYGGDTTCVELRTAGGEVVIVDAGSGIRRLGNALFPVSSSLVRERVASGGAWRRLVPDAVRLLIEERGWYRA